MKNKFILLLSLVVVSCNQRETEKKLTTKKDTIRSKNYELKVSLDSISTLLEKALKIDTLEFSNENPFIYFKSGFILNEKEKNAIVVICPTDTTYLIKLYGLNDSNFQILDSIAGLEAFAPQFDLSFDDYNFDNQKDIFIQVSASNGWSLSRGHLLIVDPTKKKLSIHNEAREFANMKPNPKTKTVTSELWNGYDLKYTNQIIVFTNKWIGGKLKTVSKKKIIVE